MGLTQAARNLFAKMTTTEDSTTEKFGTTSAYMFVGTSSVAFDSCHNKLETTVASGVSSGAVIMPMDTSYPKRNDGTDSTDVNILAYRATYATTVANFDWQEWGVKNTTATATGTGTMLNRAINTGLGTKTSAQAWQILAKITVTT